MMALKITAEEINARWHINAQPGDDPWSALFQVLVIMDAKLEKLSKSIDRLQAIGRPSLAEAVPEEMAAADDG